MVTPLEFFLPEPCVIIWLAVPCHFKMVEADEGHPDWGQQPCWVSELKNVVACSLGPLLASV